MLFCSPLLRTLKTFTIISGPSRSLTTPHKSRQAEVTWKRKVRKMCGQSRLSPLNRRLISVKHIAQSNMGLGERDFTHLLMGSACSKQSMKHIRHNQIWMSDHWPNSHARRRAWIFFLNRSIRIFFSVCARHFSEVSNSLNEIEYVWSDTVCDVCAAATTTRPRPA